MNVEKLKEHRTSIFIGLTVFGLLLMVGTLYSMTVAGFFGFGVCGFALITVLGVRDTLWHTSQPDERQERLREVAREIRFTFTDQADHNPLGLSKSFLLTQKGVQIEGAIEGTMISKWLALALPKFRNLFQRTMDEMTVSVFDYEHSEGDDSGSTVHQTVFAIKSSELGRPHVAFCPATTWDKVAAKVKSSIQIEQGYRLTGDDDNDTLTLTDGLIGLLDGATSIEVGEGHLLLYRRGVLVDPVHLDSFIKQGLQAYSTVADAIQESQDEAMLAS